MIKTNNNKKDLFFKKNVLLPPPNLTGRLHLGHYLNTVLYRIFIHRLNREGYWCHHPFLIDQAAQSSNRIFLRQYKNNTSFDQFITKQYNVIKENLEILWGKQALDLKIIRCSQKDCIRCSLTINYTFEKYSNLLLKLLNQHQCLFIKKRTQQYCISCHNILTNVSTNQIININNRIGVIKIDKKRILFLCNKYIMDVKDIYAIIFPNNNNYNLLNNIDDIINNNMTIRIIKTNDIILNLPRAITREQYNKLSNFIVINENEDHITAQITITHHEWTDHNYICEICHSHNSNQAIIYIKHKELYIDTHRVIKLIDLESKIDNLSLQPKYLIKEIKNKWIKNIEPWCITRNIKTPFDLSPTNIIIDNEIFTIKALDTWWYSSLCHMALFGIEEKIDLLITGYDILFFWIFRMILISGFLRFNLNLPILSFWKKIIIHGLIRDEQNRKLSKTLNNFISLEEYTKESNNIIDLLELTSDMLYHYKDNSDIILSNQTGKKIITKTLNLFYIINRFLIENEIVDKRPYVWMIEKINIKDWTEYSDIYINLYVFFMLKIKIYEEQLLQWKLQDYLKNYYKIIKLLSKYWTQSNDFISILPEISRKIKFIITLIYSHIFNNTIRFILQPIHAIQKFKNITNLIIQTDDNIVLLNNINDKENYALHPFWLNLNKLYNVIDKINILQTQNSKTYVYINVNKPNIWGDKMIYIIKTLLKNITYTNKNHTTKILDINFDFFYMNIKVFLVPKVGIEPTNISVWN